eukprot:TRINITY_DN22339_c1_g1_i3.p1 TRINITY_DN22339_c1_g1~~TRINITY_DN22339_c1_g1_i3.p1  ORF type:complete len:448 (-),score=48.61 TRINITY_DN22339_c1_g1_i3:563-1906(-)
MTLKRRSSSGKVGIVRKLQVAKLINKKRTIIKCIKKQEIRIFIKLIIGVRSRGLKLYSNCNTKVMMRCLIHKFRRRALGPIQSNQKLSAQRWISSYKHREFNFLKICTLISAVATLQLPPPQPTPSTRQGLISLQGNMLKVQYGGFPTMQDLIIVLRLFTNRNSNTTFPPKYIFPRPFITSPSNSTNNIICNSSNPTPTAILQQHSIDAQQQQMRMPLQPGDYVISGWQVGRQQSVDSYKQQQQQQQQHQQYAYNSGSTQSWSAAPLQIADRPQEQFQVPVLVTPLASAQASALHGPQQQQQQQQQSIEYANQHNRVVSRSVQTNNPLPIGEDISWQQLPQKENMESMENEEGEGDGDIVEVQRVRRPRGGRMYGNMVQRGRGSRGGQRGGYQMNSRGGGSMGRGTWWGNDWRRGDMRARRGGFRIRGGGVRDSTRGRTTSQSVRSS